MNARGETPGGVLRPVLVALFACMSMAAVVLPVDGLVAESISGSEQTPRIVLVHPFKNTGPKKYSWLSAALTEAVIADLYRVRGVQVISTADRQKARRELAFGQTGQTAPGNSDPESIVELGRLLGANLIFTGSYTVVGKQVRVIARLISVSSGRVEYSGKTRGTLDKLFDLEDRIVVSLLSEAEKIKLPPPRRPAPVAQPAAPAYPARPNPNGNPGDGYHDHLHPGVPPGTSSSSGAPAPATQSPLRPAPSTSSPPRPARPRPPVAGSSADKPNRPHPDAYRWYAKGLEVQYTKPALAMLYFDNALDIQADYRDALVQAGFTLGNELKKYREAEEYLDKAEAAFRGRDRRGIEYARFLRLRGAVYHGKRDYRRGLTYSQRAKKLMESLGLARTADYAYVLNNMGNAFYRRKNHMVALTLFRRSQKIQNESGLSETYKYAILMNNMGAVYNAGGGVRDALFFFRKARDILAARGLTRSAFGALVFENLGRLYRDQGQSHQAVAFFRDARQIRADLKGAGSRQR